MSDHQKESGANVSRVEIWILTICFSVSRERKIVDPQRRQRERERQRERDRLRETDRERKRERERERLDSDTRSFKSTCLSLTPSLSSAELCSRGERERVEREKQRSGLQLVLYAALSYKCMRP